MKRRDDDNHAIRMTRAITATVIESSISPDDKSVIMAQDTVRALIANIAMILAASPSVATDKALREYCDYVSERLREETMLLREDPNMKAVAREVLPKCNCSRGWLTGVAMESGI
jgi:hypothetical protein